MIEDDKGSARKVQDSQPDTTAPRRGPVIRTSDFVTPKRPQTPAATTAPAATTVLPPLSARERLQREWSAEREQEPDQVPPHAPVQKAPLVAPRSPRIPVSERLARLAAQPAADTAPEQADAAPLQPARSSQVWEDGNDRYRQAMQAAADAEAATLRPPPPKRQPVMREPVTPEVPAAPPEVQPIAYPSAQPPLIDAGMVMGSAWKHRKMVGALILGMAVLGGLASPLLPRKFTASTTLYFDPQQVKLSDGGQTGVSQEQVLAVIDSQAQILVSRRVLTQVAASLKLDKDREFGGVPAQTAAKLAKAVTVARQANTYVVDLSVKSKDPEKSANIANGIVAAFSSEQQSAAEGVYDTANTTLGGRLDELGSQLRQAEQAAADFKAENNIDNAAAPSPGSAATAGPSRTDQMETLLLTAQGKTIAAKARYDAIAKFQVADLASGQAPAEGTSTTLMQLQQQYAAAAANVGSLETKLGSRHPQLVAARATLSGVAGAVRQEITRLITGAQADYERARKEEEGVAKELSVQKALDNNISGRLIEYRELQRKVDAAREIYETVLKRTRQTGEEQRLLKSNVRVISAAEAPLQADGPSRTILMVGCVFGGLVLGLMLGLLYAVVRLLTDRSRRPA